MHDCEVSGDADGKLITSSRKVAKSAYKRMLTNGDAGLVEYIVQKWLKIQEPGIRYRKVKGAHNIQVVVKSEDGSLSWQTKMKSAVVPPLVEDAVERLAGIFLEYELAEDDEARVKANEWFDKGWLANNVQDNGTYSKVEKDVLCEMENAIATRKLSGTEDRPNCSTFSVKPLV